MLGQEALMSDNGVGADIADDMPQSSGSYFRTSGLMTLMGLPSANALI